MSIDLATLKIGVDVSQISAASDAISKLGQALSGLAKPLSNVSGPTANGVEKVGDSAEQTGKKLKGVERTVEKQATTLKVMRNQSIQAADGMIKLGDSFTKGQASQLALAKITGGTVEQLKEMAKIFLDMNKITGVNPFDKSVGHMKALKQEVAELEKINKLMASGINLSTKEVAGLSRDIIRLTEAMKSEGKATKEINKAIKELTKETVELSKAKAKEEVQLKAAEQLRKQEAQAALEAENAKQMAIAKTAAAMKQQEEILRQQEIKSQYIAQGYSASVANQGASLRGRGMQESDVKVILDRAAALEKQRKASNEAAKANQYLTELEQRLKTYVEENTTAIGQRYTDALAKLKRNIDASGLSADVAKAKYEQLSEGIKKVANEENRRNMDNLARAMSVQLGDIGISLASGQNPFIVMIQQGDQIRAAIQQANVDADQLRGTMGLAAKQIALSFRDAGIAIGGLFKGMIVSSGSAVVDLGANLLRVSGALKTVEESGKDAEGALGALYRSMYSILSISFGTVIMGAGASLLAVAVGAIQAVRENDRLVRSMALSNGQLGITSSQAFAAANAMEGLGYSAGKTLEVVEQMGKGGELTANQIQMVSKAAIDLERYGKVAIEDTVKVFSDLQKDPVDALEKLARSTGMVNRDVIEQVMLLEKLGMTYEAGQVAVREYARITGEQVNTIRDELSVLGTWWANLTETMGNAWDKFIKGLFRKDGGVAFATEKAAVEKAQETLDNIRSTQKIASFLGIDLGERDKQILKNAQETLATARNQLLVRQRSVDAAKEQAEWEARQNDLSREAAKLAKSNRSERQRLADEVVENTVKGNTAARDEDKLRFFDAAEKARRRLLELDKKGADALNKLSEAEKERLRVLEVVERFENRQGDFTPSYTNDLMDLVKAKNEYGLSTERYLVAIQGLVKVQPWMRDQLKEEEQQLKALRKEKEQYNQFVMNAEAEQVESQIALYDSLLETAKAYDAEIAEIERLSDAYELSGKQRELQIEIIKAQIEYEKDLVDIKRKFANDPDGEISARAAAAEKYGKAVRKAITGQRVAEQQEYKDYFAQLSTGISDAIVTGLFEGGKAGRKKLRDLIVGELRKKIVLQVDAYVNSFLTSGMNALFGGGKDAKGALADGKAIENLATNIASYFGASKAAATEAGKTAAESSSGLSSSAGWIALAAGQSWKDVGDGWNRDALNYTGKTDRFARIGSAPLAESSRFLERLGLSKKAADFFSTAPAFSMIFGRKAPQLQASGVQGTFSGGQFSGSQFSEFFSKGGLLRSDKSWQETSATDTSTNQAFNSSYKSTLDAIKEMSKELGIGTQALNSFTYSFRLNLKDMTEEQQLEAIQAEFGRLSDEMAKSVLNVEQYRRTGETATETLARLSSTLGSMNDAFDALGWTVFQTSLAGYDAADSFAALFGGVEQASSALSVYYENFYTQEEKATTRIRLLAEEFKKLGVTMPTTIEGFRSLVDQTRTSGNNEKLADLIELAGQFYNVIESQNSELETYVSLQKRIYELQGNTNALRELELKGLDATATELQRQIWLLEDLQSTQAKYSETLKELQKNYVDAQAAVKAAEEQIQSIRDRATDNYVAATERAASAAARASEIQEGLRVAYKDAAKSLRDFISQQNKTNSFSDLLNRVKSGDLNAVSELTNSAEDLINRATNRASTSQEASLARQAILKQVAEAAATLEGYNGSSLEEQILSTNKEMLDANKALIDANREVAEALAVANTIGASLSRLPVDLVAEFNKASADLSNARSFENAMLAALNSIKSVAQAIVENTNDLSPALQVFAQSVLTDVITTINVVANSELPPGLREIAMAGNGILERTVKFAIEDANLTETDRKLLLEQSSNVAKTFQLVADDSVLSDSEKALLLNATTSASRLVELTAQVSDTLTPEQRAVLSESNSVVTKTVKQVVESGVLTDEQKLMLASINETVTRITSLGVNDSGLTAEQKALLAVLGQTNASANLNLSGSVTWDFDAIIKEVLERIAAASEATAEVITNPEIMGPFLPWPNYPNLPGNDGGSGGSGGGSDGGGLDPNVPILPFANGGVFTNGVVNRNTPFSIGMMGESGPEAIMPLVRSSDGSLGVRMLSSGNESLIQALATLTEKVEMLEAAARSSAISNSRTAKILERVTPDGESLSVSNI